MEPSSSHSFNPPPLLSSYPHQYHPLPPKLHSYKILSASSDNRVCGPKGGRLNALASLGLPVPTLLCVTADSYLLHVQQIPEFEYFAVSVDDVPAAGDDAAPVEGPKLSSGSSSSGSKSTRSITNSLETTNSSRLKYIRDITTMQHMAELVIRGIHSVPIDPDLVEEIDVFMRSLGGRSIAVRSSCVNLEDGKGNAFAGLFETILNVNTTEGVVKAVRSVWASLWSSRIISFINVGKSPEKVISLLGSAAMGVVLQLQINSASAGICFSVNPSPGADREEVFVEAVFGQGQGIVDGSISPDTWLVHRETKNIISREIAPRTSMVALTGNSGINTIDISSSSHGGPALLDSEVIAVASYALQLEQLQGSPQDMEYAIDETANEHGERIRVVKVLQTRPITTLEDEFAPDDVPDDLPPSPFLEPFVAPNPNFLYNLDHIHVSGPLSNISAKASVEPLCRGFREASQVYASRVVNQIITINGYVFGYMLPMVPSDEGEAQRIINNAFIDKNYMKELAMWNTTIKPQVIAKHIALQAKFEFLKSMSNAELAALTQEVWDHHAYNMYLHAKCGWAHRIVVGDLIVQLESATDKVTGLEIMGIIARLSIGSPNMRFAVLLAVMEAVNSNPSFYDALYTVTEARNEVGGDGGVLKESPDGCPNHDSDWHAANKALQSLIDGSFVSSLAESGASLSLSLSPSRHLFFLS